MGEEDKCCLCFPIECGVMTLAIFTAIGAIMGLVTCYTQEDGWSLYGVVVGAQIIMTFVWIFAYAAANDSNT